MVRPGTDMCCGINHGANVGRMPCSFGHRSCRADRDIKASPALAVSLDVALRPHRTTARIPPQTCCPGAGSGVRDAAGHVLSSTSPRPAGPSRSARSGGAAGPRGCGCGPARPRSGTAGCDGRSRRSATSGGGHDSALLAAGLDPTCVAFGRRHEDDTLHRCLSASATLFVRKPISASGFLFFLGMVGATKPEERRRNGQ
jgi:hypothetical protein